MIDTPLTTEDIKASVAADIEMAKDRLREIPYIKSKFSPQIVSTIGQRLDAYSGTSHLETL